jgi:hypothetical protein
VAATDPGAVDGAGAGVHAILGGSLVVLDGQRAKVPGSFGAMGDQTAAALSRSGRDVASVVTLRPGAPTRPRRCGSGPPAGAVQGAEDRTLSRPSGRSTTVWVVVDATTWCG